MTVPMLMARQRSQVTRIVGDGDTSIPSLSLDLRHTTYVVYTIITINLVIPLVVRWMVFFLANVQQKPHWGMPHAWSPVAAPQCAQPFGWSQQWW